MEKNIKVALVEGQSDPLMRVREVVKGYSKFKGVVSDEYLATKRCKWVEGKIANSSMEAMPLLHSLINEDYDFVGIRVKHFEDKFKGKKIPDTRLRDSNKFKFLVLKPIEDALEKGNSGIDKARLESELALAKAKYEELRNADIEAHVTECWLVMGGFEV